MSSLYAVMQSSTSIASRPSMIAISLTLLATVGQASTLEHLPARARAAYKIEDVTWFHGSKIISLACMIESVHKPFQDVKRRQAAHPAAIE
jgi:hypothetical protein